MSRTEPRGIARALRRVVGLAIVAAAGVGGWIGVDELALADSDTIPLPALGDGLPTARLDEPAPWRRFQLTYEQPDHTEHYWFDLDEGMIRSQVVRADTTDSAEIFGDMWYWQTGVDGEWMEQDPTTTRTIAGFAMGGVGPFLLTDLVPPDTLGFTSLELEGTSKGERVYEVTVDAETLELQHPLAYSRWVTTTRILGDGSAVFRIRVRPDGYIVRIDSGESSATWRDLPGGVRFESPLAELVAPADTPPGTPAGTPAGTDAPAAPTAEPAPPADPDAPSDTVELTPIEPLDPVTSVSVTTLAD